MLKFYVYLLELNNNSLSTENQETWIQVSREMINKCDEYERTCHEAIDIEILLQSNSLSNNNSLSTENQEI